MAVGWSSTNGTWPSERDRRLERTVRRSRVRSRLWQRTMPSWLFRGTLPLISGIGPCARQCARSSDGYPAHLALEMQEDIPAHVEARIADVCDFFREQFNEGARRSSGRTCPRTLRNICSGLARRGASRVDLRRGIHRPLAKHVFSGSWCELDTARSTPPGCRR